MAVQSICIPIGEDPSAPDDELDELVLLLPPLLVDDELSATPPTPVELKHWPLSRILASELNTMSAHWRGMSMSAVCLIPCA